VGKVIVIVVLIAILASLGSALWAILRGGPTLHALTLRVALSIGLFVFLLIAYATGLISPHGL
jgi:hypothetical protein